MLRGAKKFEKKCNNRFFDGIMFMKEWSFPVSKEQTMPVFINPFTDFGFKRIFGQEDSKIILMGFLNALFEGEFVVIDLEYRDKEQLPERPSEHGVIFDVFCTIDTGERFILEMQNKYQ